MKETLTLSGGSQTSLRQANRKRVVSELIEHGNVTQAAIARRTGLAASTVSNIIAELEAQGLVARGEGNGPHGTKLSFHPEAGYVLGVEVGHRHLTIVCADLSRKIVAEERVGRPQLLTFDDDFRFVTREISAILERSGIRMAEVLAAGLAVPAPVDLAGQYITSGEILPLWDGVDVPARFTDALGIPVRMENDANLGALGEFTWAHPVPNDLAYVKIADGIGAGLILGGKIYRGADGSAGEIGHTTIDENGAMCRCGNRGCLETVAAVPAILRAMHPLMGEDVTIHDIISSAHNGNTACRRILADTGSTLGLTISNMLNTVNPRLVVIGGLLAEAGPLIIDSLEQTISRYAMRGVREHLMFRPSTLGLRTHVLGAISLALEEVDVV